MLVSDLMQREVATLEAADSLDLADDVMRLGRIRHMPVVSGERLVGILSQRDLFRAAVSSSLKMHRSAEREWLAKIPVRDVMTGTVVTVGPGATLAEAVRLMLDRRIGCLPVVDQGRLIGLLSESDCLRHLARLLDISEAKNRLPELPEEST
ncbi:CBS domain-containing protein [Candidatus Binatia bacterium]|nr:CBS domain-containing protein [Candidatus Binatia bacterium]